MTSPTRVEIARAAAAAGAAAAAEYLHRPAIARWDKLDGSIVTEADLAAEQAVLAVLHRFAPGEAVLSEESGGATELTEVWIVDPIDGTENFSRRHPVWGTLVAWHDRDAVAAAAIDAPGLDRRWWAAAGRGAHGVSGRLQTSAVRERRLAGFAFGGAHEYPVPAWEALTDVMRGFRTAWGWGNFWGHMMVAEGSVDAALSYGTSPWDVAAPALIVAEAGGAWTDMSGARDLRSGSLLTTNKTLHNELTADLRRCPISPNKLMSD
ncbi:inositol monophosphatase family protein [Streptomyces sp. NPDC088864]|uniref:inositol monophosphatase family protein n=1 Tax=Streptomyces sp. NPDC088864 TaxID=3365910 RepID=UPI003808D074